LGATVVVKEITGAAGARTYTTVDNVSAKARYKTKDEATSDLNYPCVIPAASYVWSYWKSHCLALSGSFTRINNLRWYPPGTISWTLGTGGGVFVAQRATGDHGCPDASYAQATGTEGTQGDGIFTSHAYYLVGAGGAASVIATTYTSGSMMTVDSGNHDAAEYTKSIVSQAKIYNDATQGLQSAITLTFVWDEI
jgi:hypothetical protein